MDEKTYLTNKSFCPIPWTGVMLTPTGDVKTCIRSSAPIGNIDASNIEDIVNGSINQSHKNKMINKTFVNQCQPCYELESNKKDFNIISDRIFYLKELKAVDLSLYDKIDNFDLHKVDIRWNNLCNFACVYCGPEFSSTWANELSVSIRSPNENNLIKFKEYVFTNAKKLKHVYLAGGEPLLIKENLELLDILSRQNPNVHLRVNTNLSKIETRIFEKICTFKNVHWIVSIETIQEQFEYVRYGGNWQDFLSNLDIIKKNQNHTLSFNMLYFLLNSLSIIDCITYLKNLGFHNNSFIVGPLHTPHWLNVRHLPSSAISVIQQNLINFIEKNPGFLLEDGLTNVLKYLETPIEKNISMCLEQIKTMDQRRQLNSRQIFSEFYNLIEDHHHG